MGRRFRRVCKECGSMASITKTERIHEDLDRCYCRCNNPDCKHIWVIDVSFRHTIVPSQIGKNGLLHYLVSKLPDAEISKLQMLLDERRLAQAS